MAKNGISRHTNESVNANDMCSASVYAPTACRNQPSISEKGGPETLTPFDGVYSDEKRYTESLPE